MGAKNCPETPRQKMINMMYLVLTAMLALNVAAEVLEAFRVVDASLTQTLSNVDLKNDQIYGAFSSAYLQNPTKVKEWKEKADELKSRSDSLNDNIMKLKERLVLASGGVFLKDLGPDYVLEDNAPIFVNKAGDTLLIKKEDDLNTPSEIMIQQKAAKQLKEQIIAYRDYLASLLDSSSTLRTSIIQDLDTSDPKINLKEGGEKKTWESLRFENKPLIAVITMLSKIQIDVKNAETNVASNLYSQIDASSFKFNKLGAQVIAKSTYVLRGDVFEAQIFLAAEDSTQRPEILVNNRPLEMAGGKGIYKVPAKEVGTFKWGGLIKYKTPEGGYNTYPFEGQYQVGEPSVTISPTKMNVLYVGIPNPVSISVPGIPSENIEVTMTNGRIEKNGGDFLVYPSKTDNTGKATSISVVAKFGNERRPMGSMPFRVKEVPPPVATVGGKNGGNIKKEDFLVEDGIFAELKDFDFDLKFTITGFDITLTGAGGYVKTWSAKSNRFTNEQKEQLKKISVGSIIYIDNITAKGDDGTNRTLSPVSFKIR